MRSRIMLVLSLLILGALNYGIYEKENLKEQGETILLELAPVDPRSLMQGDYMQLRYAIERTANEHKQDNSKKRGHLVIKPDENNVAQFVRFYTNEQLKDKEKLLYFHRKFSIRIVPDSFFFQEGHAKYYDDAKYGIFKFDNSGNKLLVGLADDNREEIIVNTTKGL